MSLETRLDQGNPNADLATMSLLGFERMQVRHHRCVPYARVLEKGHTVKVRPRLTIPLLTPTG